MNDVTVGSAEITGDVTAIAFELAVFVDDFETSYLLIRRDKMILEVRRDFGV